MRETPEQIIARRCADLLWPEDKASQELGMELETVGPGHAVVTMTVRDTMTNGHGTCHGGFIFTLADSAFAFACNSYDARTVAAAADISFLRAAMQGDVLRADARETWREGRNGIYDVEVTNQAGGVIAQFRGKSRTIGGAILPSEESDA